MWAGYELPDLGLSAAEPVASRLEAAYWDTPDLRLLRRSVTLREEAGEWTLRGPDGAAVALDPGEWAPRSPDAAVLPPAVLGWTLGEPLREVARLATERESFALSNRRGEVARLARDDVALLRGERVAARFRELELTPLDGAPERVVERIEARLREAGAQSLDPVPKVVRGLAPAALEPPPAPPEAGPDASAARRDPRAAGRRPRSLGRLSGAAAPGRLAGQRPRPPRRDSRAASRPARCSRRSSTPARRSAA